MDHIYDESYAQRIGSFMEWASDKLREEVKLNEALEKEFGTAEHLIPASGRKDYDLSVEDKIDIIKEIDEARSYGIQLTDACDNEGIHVQTYYKWKRILKLPTYKQPSYKTKELC